MARFGRRRGNGYRCGAAALLGVQAGARSGGAKARLSPLVTCSARVRRQGCAAACTRAAVPLPKPRPAEAPQPSPRQPAADKPAPRRDRQAGRAGEPPAAPPQPSACRLALTEEIAIAPSIPDIHGPGGCGGEDLVRLEAVVLPDKQRVAVKPAATLRCAMATAIADWVRTDIVPLAESLGSEISDARQFRFLRMPRPQPRRRRANCPSMAAPMRSTCARSSSPTASRSR